MGIWLVIELGQDVMPTILNKCDKDLIKTF